MTDAVILLSGGLDSATAAAIALAEGWRLHALSIDYGQRHVLELEAATRVASALDIAHHVIVPLDLRVFGGSALTAADIAVPKRRDAAEIGHGIPSTYVPARNTIFLSLALALAEVSNAVDIVIGANALDYSGYPDCRPIYIRAFEKLATLATKAGAEGARFRIHAPLMELDKAGIIRRGAALGLDYSITLSCYDPTPAGLACGACDSCQLRRKGFREAGLPDPTRYAEVEQT